MRISLTLPTFLAADLLSTGCMSSPRRNTAMAVFKYGADTTVVGKLERGRQLSLADLEERGRRGVPDILILAHLRSRTDTYRLTTAQVIGLRSAGLGEGAVNYLLVSRERVVRPARRGYQISSHRSRGDFGRYGGFRHGSEYRGAPR